MVIDHHRPHPRGLSVKLAYNLNEAAEAASVSVETLRRAIKATDPRSFPPPLEAKRIGSEKKASYRILAADLQAWLDSLPAA